MDENRADHDSTGAASLWPMAAAVALILSGAAVSAGMFGLFCGFSVLTMLAIAGGVFAAAVVTAAIWVDAPR